MRYILGKMGWQSLLHGQMNLNLTDSSFVKISLKHFHSPIEKVREMTFREKLYLPPHVKCHMLCIKCLVSHITCLLSHVMCHPYIYMNFKVCSSSGEARCWRVCYQRGELDMGHRKN